MSQNIEQVLRATLAPAVFVGIFILVIYKKMKSADKSYIVDFTKLLTDAVIKKNYFAGIFTIAGRFKGRNIKIAVRFINRQWIEIIADVRIPQNLEKSWYLPIVNYPEITLNYRLKQKTVFFRKISSIWSSKLSFEIDEPMRILDGLVQACEKVEHGEYRF